jgi:BolA family transcriptional regulator, general stress-responsive regulator
MTVRQTIIDKLTKALAPDALDVRDDSQKHIGHAGWREEGETHFHLRMVAPLFTGLNRVERQRAVHKALEEELKGRVHALSTELKAPGE